MDEEKIRLVWVSEKTAEDDAWLEERYEGDDPGDEDEMYSVVEAIPGVNVTSEDLAEHIFGELENANYHSFTDIGRIVRDAVLKHADEATAVKVLWEIVTQHSSLVR